MGHPHGVRSAALVTLGAGILGFLWLLRGGAGSGAPASEPALFAARSSAPAGPLTEPAGPPARHPAEWAEVLALPASDLDDALPPPGSIDAEDPPEGIAEREFYERFVRAAQQQLGELEAQAEGILRGAGPDPEKVALLRVLGERGSERVAELYLLALRELSDESDPQGESVPSAALGLLDRRASRDAQAREILRRAAFEAPPPPATSRRRAAAIFFLRATEEELLATRAALGRETDPHFLESALEALSRNPNTSAAALLLAPFGRSPAVAAGDGGELP